MSKAGTAAIKIALISILPGPKLQAVASLLSEYINGKTYDHGQVFVIRGYSYQYSYLQ